MKHQWLNDITCKDVEALTGAKVKRIVQGLIPVGTEKGLSERGQIEDIPILKRGIEIEFEKDPTPSELQAIDAMLTPAGLRRRLKEGETLPDPDQELAAAIESAKTFAELKAALLGQIRNGRVKGRPI